jgi:hypothetical protein
MSTMSISLLFACLKNRELLRPSSQKVLKRKCRYLARVVMKFQLKVFVLVGPIFFSFLDATSGGLVYWQLFLVLAIPSFSSRELFSVLLHISSLSIFS